MRRVVPLLLTLGVLAGVSADASAYDPRLTHRWITHRAIDFLVKKDPRRYRELARYAGEIADGVEHEDDGFLDGDTEATTLRVMRHFFSPTDQGGLVMDGDRYPSSFEWGAMPSEQNRWGWDDALARYRQGDPAAAYFALGHVVHLIQDLTVPAHSHLDIHGPPQGDDYEGYCTSQVDPDLLSSLPIPAEDAPLPEFEDLKSLWQATGDASYWRNMYPGDLSDPEAPAGVVAEMFPEIHMDWLSQKWEIPGVGKLGKAFREHASGYYYFKELDAAAAIDRVEFDPARPRAGAKHAPNEAGAPMTELVARDMIPLAILHSAALMEMFVEETAKGPEAREPDTEEMGTGGGCAAGGSASGQVLFAVCVILALARRKYKRETHAL